VVGKQHRAAGNDVNVPISAACGNKNGGWFDITAPATDAAKQWDGWGTALKPACEFFTLARKPLSEKTVAANVLKWGTGGINIDACRVGTEGSRTNASKPSAERNGFVKGFIGGTESKDNNQGRFPANLIHDGSQEVLDLFPETKGDSKNRKPRTNKGEGNNCFGDYNKATFDIERTDKGSAARFFYCPKASKKDRDEGLEGFEDKKTNTLNDYKNPSEGRTASKSGGTKKNNHPTVKPTALMSYLCRLITPTDGTVLDPYMGSGSTGKAAIGEGFSFVGCELDKHYYNIAKARVRTT